MKKEYSLKFNVASSSENAASRNVGNSSVPGDISGYDGHYAFSCNWKWEHVIPEPADWDGNPISVTLTATADDSAKLKLGEISVSASYDTSARRPGTNTATGSLMPGVYEASLSFSNIDYNPPSGNVAVLNYGISAGAAGTLVPEENEEDPEQNNCRCDENEDDAGGENSSSVQNRIAGTGNAAEISSSSAGTRTTLKTNETFARWRTSFGKFRGLGGISAGTLEILAYEFSEDSATPAGLEFRHPLASRLVVPAGGISAGTQFKHCSGGGYVSWVCDGSGSAFFKIGSSKKKTTEARWTADKSGVEILFPDKSSVTYSAMTGEIISYKTHRENVFTAAQIANYLDVVRDENGVLQQVWNLWDGLANVENATASGYTIALYLPAQVGVKNPQTGKYSVTGTAFKTFSVALADSKISVTETDSRAGAIALPVKFWFQNNAWNESRGSGNDEIFTTRSRTNNLDGSWQLETTKKIGENGVPASVVSEVFLTTDQGNLRLSRTDGFGTAFAQTTTYEYDDVGRMIKETRPDGSEIITGYDQNGRLYSRSEPQAGARCRTTYFHYVSDNSNDTDLSYTETSISRESGFFVLSRTDYSYIEETEFRRVEKRTSGVGSEVVQTEVEETWRGTCANIYARGRIKMSQNKIGVQTHYDYAGTTLHGALYTVTAETKISGVPANGKSEREVKFISASGNVLREEKYVLDSAGTWKLVSTADFEYDSQNRRTKRTRGNGRETTREMMCCGTLWEIDEDGVRTDYTYNSARMLTETMRAETATMSERIAVFTRDAHGNALSETIKLNGPTFSEKSKTFDILGRVSTETDELGRITTHEYSAGGLTETVTLPSGATLITEKHADGTILRRAGTGQRELLFSVDFVSDGIRTQTKLADNTTVIAREIRNGFGETIRTETINTADDFFCTRHLFDARGLRTQSQSDGAAPTLFEYDDFGNESRRILKLASTPTAENSRIRETETVFETRADGIYSTETTTNYNAAGTAIVQSTARLISESPTIESKTISSDVRGNISVAWTEFGEATIRLQKSQIPSATNIAQTQIVDGFTTQKTDFAGTTLLFSRQFNTGTNAGILLTSTDGRGNATVVEQNVLGWTTKTTDASGAVTTVQYNLAHGKPALITNALGETAATTYDLRGRKIAEFGTAVQPALFDYDEADNLVSQKLFRAGTETISTDPAERTDFDETTWSYDAKTNLLLYKRFPDQGQTDYTYDAKNRLADVIFSREISAGTRLKSVRAYDEQTGELISISYNDGTPSVSHSYNHLGWITQTVDSAGSHAFAYDAYGARISETLTGTLFSRTKTLTFHFDALGRDIGYSIDGSRKTTLSYDPATGRLASCLAGTANFSWEYLAGTNLKKKLTYPNAATAEWSYEANRDLLTQVKNTVNGNVISQYDYANDALGRRTAMTKSGTLFAGTDQLAYGYNTRSELTSAVASADANYNYAYAFDNIGNRNSSTDAGTQLAYTTNALNQYSAITPTSSAETFTPTYDADGNATSVKTSTGTWSISNDGENRPAVWTKSTGEKIYMMFDALGRRVEKRVLNAAGTRTLRERYVYVGYTCVQILNGDGGNAVVKEFVWDPTEPVATRPLMFGYISKGLYFFYTIDGNKNVSDVFFFALGNGIGAHYEYAPFGAITRTSSATHIGNVDIVADNPFRFSSEFYDSELDLVYYNYRHYSPALGRFLSRDPIEEQGGVNLYAFAKNNPCSRFDVLGREGLPSCSEYSSIRNCHDGVCEGRTSRQGLSCTASVNGCGPHFTLFGIDFGDYVVPDSVIGAWALFALPCSVHDSCYATCGSNRDVCDQGFYEDMISSCEDEFSAWNPLRDICFKQAKIYYEAVSFAGNSPYESAQDEHCQWASCCEGC